MLKRIDTSAQICPLFDEPEEDEALTELFIKEVSNFPKALTDLAAHTQMSNTWSLVCSLDNSKTN